MPWVFILCYRWVVIVTSTSLSSLDTSLLNSTEVDCIVATWLTVFARASKSYFWAVWLLMAIPLSHHELSPLYHFWVLQFHGVFWEVHFKPVKGHAIESVWFDKPGTSSWYGRDETYSTIRQPDRWGGPLLVKQLGVTVVVLDLENVLVDVAWCVIHRVLHPRFDLEYRWQFLH